MLFRSDRKSTRLNSSHTIISYAVFCLKKKPETTRGTQRLRCRGPQDADRRRRRAGSFCASAYVALPATYGSGVVVSSSRFFFLMIGDPRNPTPSPLPPLFR